MQLSHLSSHNLGRAFWKFAQPPELHLLLGQPPSVQMSFMDGPLTHAEAKEERGEEVYLNFVPLLRDPRYFLMVHIFPSHPIIHSHLISSQSSSLSERPTSHALSTDAVLAIRDKISALLRDLLLH